MILLPALLLLAALVACAYRLGVWVRTTASQRVRTCVTLAVLAIFVIGLFVGMPSWAAITLSILVLVCVAADFLLLHHRRESDIAG